MADQRRKAVPNPLFRAVLLTTVVAAGIVGGCRADDKEAAQATTPPQPVQAMSVEFTQEARAWSYVGTVEPRYETSLAFRVGGKILERLVDNGQTVKPGDVIARLDTTDFELQVSAQQAELTAATASKSEADAALARYQTLFVEGHVAKAALDQRASGAAEAKGRQERAQRGLELARNQLAYGTLTADQAGVVTAVSVEKGQVVAAGQQVVKVARLDAVEVEVAIPENQIEDVRHATAAVEIWLASGALRPATLREVTPQADPASRTYRARFAIKEADGLTFGRTATVKLTAEGQGKVVALPLSAVTNDGKGAKVWVLSADRTHALPLAVEVRAVEQNRVLVSAPFKSGDLVITLGAHILDPDKPVRLVEQRTTIGLR